MNKTKINIAIVDDHQLIRNGLALLIRSFASKNYEFSVVLEASNGKEFLDCLSTIESTGHIPNIVLLDFSMPSMNGLQTIQILREVSPNMKILMLTMHNDDNTVIRTLRAGASGYLLKDIDPENMQKAIESVAEKGYYYSEMVTTKLVRNLNSVPGNGTTDLDTESIRLTEKEIQFLRLSCSEMTYSEIARQMGLSTRTIDGYREILFTKLNVRSRVGLVLWAINNNVLKQ